MIRLTASGARNSAIVRATSTLNVVTPVLLAYSGYYLQQRHGHTGTLLPRLTDTGDVIALGVLFACVVYLLAFSAMSLVLPTTKVSNKRKKSTK